MLENLKVGLIILLTGIVVVFAVLILLIVVIKLYSSIVYNAQNKKNKKDENKTEKAETDSKPVELAVKPESKSVSVENAPPSDGTIPGEIVAAIAAAVEVIFGQGAVSIKSVKKTSKRRSAWKSAGVAENTRSF